jgi:hypothetical protein
MRLNENCGKALLINRHPLSKLPGPALEPTITTVTKIASALGVSIDELVKGSKNNEKRKL